MSASASSPPVIPEIIQRYLAGASVQDLARENSVCPRTIYNWMLREKGDEYDSMITEMLINRIADADVRLELADDAVQIARAREAARYARMDFERRRPLLYGPKQQIQQDTSISITIQQLTPQPVVSDPTIIETKPLTTQLLTDQGSDAYVGPPTDGQDKT